MSLLKERPSANRPLAPDRVRTLQERGDRWLFLGMLICGSVFLGPIGLAIMAYGVVLLRRAQAAGEHIRPWAVTIIGVFCVIDGAFNFIAWGFDLLPSHDTTMFQTFMNGWGKLFDGAYYIGYNSIATGGTSFLGEKAFQIMGVMIMYPMRIAAGWGFLKMRRWGLQFMIITSWMYVMFWIGYIPLMALYFEYRYPTAIFGILGYWVYTIWYATPFIMLPYLHTVNREQFAT